MRYWKYDGRMLPIEEDPQNPYTIEEIQAGLARTFPQLANAKHEIIKGEEVLQYGLNPETDEVIVFYVEGGKNGLI